VFVEEGNTMNKHEGLHQTILTDEMRQAFGQLALDNDLSVLDIDPDQGSMFDIELGLTIDSLEPSS
jgi:hypothetical protein